MTNYSRSVLLSNGYKHPENRLKKFEVSLKITSTNLAKKLPSQTLSQTVSHRDFQLLSQTAHVCFHRRKCTHSPLLKGSHTTAHTPKQGRFRWGALLLPSDCFTRFGNPAWPGGRTANFAVFGPWSGVLPKNAESLRDSDALMRVAVPKASRPRLGCVIFFASAEIAVCTSCAQAFCVCEAWVVSLPSARFTCC